MWSAGLSFFEGVDESWADCPLDRAPKYAPMERFMLHCDHRPGERIVIAILIKSGSDDIRAVATAIVVNFF